MNVTSQLVILSLCYCYFLNAGILTVSEYMSIFYIQWLFSEKGKISTGTVNNESNSNTIGVKQESYYMPNGLTSKIHNKITPNFQRC